MDTREAQALAIRLMIEHGIAAKGWKFEFDTSLRRFGCCSYRHQTISLSRTLVELNALEAVRDTILHEIAHALAGPLAKHGRLWRLQAQAIGARPERCYSANDVVTPKAPWQAICQFCQRTIKRHRMREVLRKAWCNCPVSSAQFPRVYLKWERTQ